MRDILCLHQTGFRIFLFKSITWKKKKENAQDILTFFAEHSRDKMSQKRTEILDKYSLRLLRRMNEMRKPKRLSRYTQDGY